MRGGSGEYPARFPTSWRGARPTGAIRRPAASGRTGGHRHPGQGGRPYRRQGRTHGPVPARRHTARPERVAAPSASAALRTGSVRLHLAMDLPYPTDIPHVCERIQHDVAKQVTQLTGLEVGEVTLTVRRLVTAADAGRGRVR